MVEPHSNSLEATCIQLVDAARNDRPGAWEELVSTFERLVWAVPVELGLSPADAEEVFQATWVSLHASLDRLDRPGGLAAWLTITARRHAWRLFRRRRSESPLGEEAELHADEDPGPVEQAALLETRLRVQAALEGLSGRCRDLLTRLYYAREEASYAAISRETGMPVGSIGPTRMRCLAELARKLERSDRDP